MYTYTYKYIYINFLAYYVYITQYTLKSVHIMYTNATIYSSTKTHARATTFTYTQLEVYM